MYDTINALPLMKKDTRRQFWHTFDRLTTFLEKIRRKAKFHYWLFAHYHDNKIIDERYVLLWEQIVQII